MRCAVLMLLLMGCSGNVLNPVGADAYKVKVSKKFPSSRCQKLGAVEDLGSPLYSDKYHVNKLRELAFQQDANFLKLPFRESANHSMKIIADVYRCPPKILKKIVSDKGYDPES